MDASMIQRSSLSANCEDYVAVMHFSVEGSWCSARCCSCHVAHTSTSLCPYRCVVPSSCTSYVFSSWMSLPVLHLRVEGQLELCALSTVPCRAPFELLIGQAEAQQHPAARPARCHHGLL